MLCLHIRRFLPVHFGLMLSRGRALRELGRLLQSASTSSSFAQSGACVAALASEASGAASAGMASRSPILSATAVRYFRSLIQGSAGGSGSSRHISRQLQKASLEGLCLSGGPRVGGTLCWANDRRCK